MNCASIAHDHRTFRAILRAMSRPGQVQQMPKFASDKTAVSDLLRCLIDNVTRLAVLGDDRLAKDLSHHCECRLSEVPDADFIIVAPGADTAPLDWCKRGNLLYPDGGATVVFLVDDLAENEDGITLRGPGIPKTIRLRISGLGDGEWARLSRLNGEFPLGVDAMFLARSNGQLACIPRSTRIGGR